MALQNLVQTKSTSLIIQQRQYASAAATASAQSSLMAASVKPLSTYMVNQHHVLDQLQHHQQPQQMLKAGTSKQCRHPGCSTRPVYNIKGETRGLYCRMHKGPAMINVQATVCQFEGCRTQSYFNQEGASGGRYCRAHRLPGMVDVVNRRCLSSGCKKFPLFNTAGESQGVFCSAHKETFMVNVVTNLCEHDGCSKQPVFNVRGMSKGRFAALIESPAWWTLPTGNAFTAPATRFQSSTEQGRRQDSTAALTSYPIW